RRKALQPLNATRLPLPPVPSTPGQVPSGHEEIHLANSPPEELENARIAGAKLRLDMARHARNRYEIEIHKKFSLAAACFIFVLVGAPIAVRFPRGGVGLVIGVSLLV